MRFCRQRLFHPHAVTLAFLAIGAALMGFEMPAAQAQSITYTPNWIVQNPTTVPPPRYATSIAYDAATGQLVMYGGTYAAPTSVVQYYDTWVWNGANWIEVATPAGMTVSSEASMAYDAATGQLVLFGVAGGISQTWVWNGATWTQMSPPTSPSARGFASMSYDAATQQLVLFGGEPTSGFISVLADTWVWNGTTWTLQKPVHSPVGRAAAAMAYDAATGQIVLFGGSYTGGGGPANSGELHDTWTWNGTDWTQQSPASSPASTPGMMAYDAALGQLVLLGFGTTNPTWLYNGSTWTQLSVPGVVPNLNTTSMDYDAATGQIVLFGGLASNQVNGRNLTYTFGTVNLGDTNVCATGATTPSPCSQTTTLNFTVGATAQTVSHVNVLTQGAPNLDFTEVSDTCTQTLAAGAACTVTVKFAPQHPGLRTGSITLTDVNGNVLGSAPIEGIGMGPQVTYSGAATPVTALGSAVAAQGYDGGVAVNSAGTVYVSNAGSAGALLLEMTPNCASAACTTTIGGLASAPAVTGAPGVAVDGAGNVYMANSAAGVYEIPNGCTAASCAFVVPASYTSSSAYIPNPEGVAVDGFGNLYVSGGTSGSSIYEIPSGCSNFSCVLTLGSGFNFNGAVGLAVDANGNIYVASSSGNAIYEVPGGCTLSSCVTTVASGFNSPTGVAVDAAGDVYVADNSQVIKEVSAAGVASTISTGSLTPAAVAVDGSGNLYFVPQNSSQAYEIPQATPPAVSFPTSTLDGTTDTTDGTQTVTLANDGNAALLFAIPTTGTNPAAGADFTFATTGSSTCPALTTSTGSTASLAPGSTCTLPLTFTPVVPSAGALSENLTLTDNNLNTTAATQSIALSGRSTIGAPTVTSVSPAYGTAAGGTIAQINGTNFANVTGVYFGSVQATVDTAAGGVKPTAIYVLVPPGTGGATVDVTVQTAQGTSAASLADQFLYTYVQNISSFLPPASATYGQAPITLSASGGGSGNAITFKVNSGPGSIATGSNLLTITGVGTIVVEADQAGNAAYAAATPVTANVIVGPATPTITWATPAGITYGTPLSATQLNAQATGVTGTTLTGTLKYTPSLSTILSAGSSQTLSVSFTPTDSTHYISTTATVQINVSQATPTVSWATPAAISYGTALSATQLNATASVPGTFLYSSALGATLTAGNENLSVTFTPTDTIDYTTTTKSVTLVVNKAAPTVTWAAPASITYGTALSASQLNATASVPGTFAYSPALGATPIAGNDTLSVMFTPTDTADYTTMTKTVPLVVNQAAPTVTWTAPAGITYGTALSASQLNATASVPGTFAYLPALGAILRAGSDTLSVTFTPTDTTDYTSKAQTVVLSVAQATPAVTWTTPAAVTFGTALSAAQLNATASVPGTFAYSPALGSVPATGPDLLSVTFTPADTNDYTSATAKVTLTVSQATPTVTWSSPAAITYGTTLTAAQLNATASTPGTFTYSPALGTVLSAGAQSLKVTFTPTDTTDYVAANGSTSITVNRAPLTITANSTNRVFGAANPIFTGTVSATVNGDVLIESFSTPATVTSIVGSYPIVPSVSGASVANYAVTPVNGALTVSQVGTGTTFALSNQNLTLTATVVSLTSGTPTGSVGFYEGQTLIGTGTLSNGVATYTAASFPSGDVVVSAEYSGDANFTESQSPPILFLSVSATSTSISVAQTGSVSDALNVSVAPGYVGTVQFTCAGLPANSTCSFAPASVAFTGTNNTVSVMLTVQTTVNASLTPPALPPSIGQRLTSFAAIFLIPGVLLAGFAGRRQKLGPRLQLLGLWLVLGCIATSVTACSSAPSRPSPTPPGAVTLQVMASGPGGLAQSTNLTLTVQ
jgi:hypothetical protein